MTCQRCGKKGEITWRGLPITHVCAECIYEEIRAMRLSSGTELMMMVSNYAPTAVHRAMFAAYFNGTREGRA